MRNDQLPEHNAESERTPSQHFMDYTPLVTLQERLNALEDYYGGQYQNDDSPFVPRVARVAPMSTAAERGVLPPIIYRTTATVDISALHLPNPTAASFTNAAAAAAAAEAAEAAAAASAAAAAAATAAAPTRIAAVHAAAVRCAPHSATHATAPSNTATYASPPVSYTTTHPSLYCIASTFNALSRNRGPSGSNSNTATVASTQTMVAPDHDYDMIPAFRRRALISSESEDAVVLRRRTFDDYEDEEMAEQAVPRKMAKRSEEHMTAASGAARNDEDDDDDVMDCGP